MAKLPGFNFSILSPQVLIEDAKYNYFILFLFAYVNGCQSFYLDCLEVLVSWRGSISDHDVGQSLAA